MKHFAAIFLFFAMTGCAALTGPQWETGPEYDQKVLLLVNSEYKNFQAVQSTYDVGDLQSFHTQHTFPILVEGAFDDIFGQVEILRQGAGIEPSAPEVAAIFEVHLIDLAHDIYTGADSYRAEAMIAVAMKSPDGDILWQEAFRGHGYVTLDPQFSQMQMGPQDAVVDAVRDALYQMQEAIAGSPVIQRQLAFGKAYEEARRRQEVRL